MLPVDGAAVLLMADDTHWSVAAATDTTIAACEDLQLTVGEGPSIAAYATGGPVLLSDLVAAAGPWPVFAASAPLLVRAWFSLPLQIGAVRFGVLDLYRCTAGVLGRQALADALRLADLAAAALVHRPAIILVNRAERVPTVVDCAPEVDQATGMISVHLGVDLGTAYARLRGFAFASGRSLVEVAGAVVAGRLRLDEEDRRDESRR
jgi:hypothetical protein